jgi:dTDP-4-dehydrorhamnose 3,5-epimerase-like enzyme
MVTIEPLEQIGQDERGATFVFDTDRRGQLIVAHRKEGTVNGRHYHKGVNSNKNPEELILMKGTIRINWKDLRESGTISETGTIQGTGPARIVIPAYIWHEIIALTDFVMLELNSTEDGRSDTYRID